MVRNEEISGASPSLELSGEGETGVVVELTGLAKDKELDDDPMVGF